MNVRVIGYSGKEADGSPGMMDACGGHVELKLDGDTLWVNVEGVCRLRAEYPEPLSLSGDKDQWQALLAKLTPPG